MQTFVTSASEIGTLHVTIETFRSLDDKRLGKQRVEALQIYSALTTGKGWIHHPATKMWAGKEGALAMYGYFCCREWKERGFEDSMEGNFYDLSWKHHPNGMLRDDWPWWYGHPEMVRSHQSKLYHKLPEHYGPNIDALGLWPDRNLRRPLPYLWPDAEQEGLFTISKSEWSRQDEWQLAPNWFLSEERVVGFE